MPTVETEYQLEVVRTALIGSNGVAMIDGIGPGAPFERWEIRATQVSNDGANATKLEIHGNSSRSILREGSFAGRFDNSDTVFKLLTDQKLYYRWTGGTPGSLCTLTLTGSRYVRGDRGGGL